MSNKIRITSEEIHSPRVDERLRQQGATDRAQSHYEQQSGTAIGGFNWSQLLYNTMVYMGLFGLVGGLLAWLVAELVFLIFFGTQENYDYVWQTEQQLIEQANNGEITSEEAARQIVELRQAYSSNPYLQIEADESLSDDERVIAMDQQLSRDGISGLIGIIFLFGWVGILISGSLSIAEDLVSSNWRGVIIKGSIGIAAGVVGATVGAIATTVVLNLIVEPLIGSPEDSFFTQVVWRTIAWSMVGGSLAVAPGVSLKNWKRFAIGLAGGIIGGTLGGMLFDIIAEATNSAVGSRFVAICAIGMVTGIGTGVLETATKSGWLRVAVGLIAGKQFVLYKNPTYIGSSPQCEIYLFKDPAIAPRHAAVHKRPGGFEIESLDESSPTFVNGQPVSRTRLKSGDSIQIGGTVFLFQERAKR